MSPLLSLLLSLVLSDSPKSSPRPVTAGRLASGSPPAACTSRCSKTARRPRRSTRLPG
jgi:hypothetical protein